MKQSNNFVKISPKILSPRIPELGQIKIGGKGEERTARGGNRKYRLPVKFTHFQVVKRERDKATENLLIDEAVHKVVGAKPMELDIRLMFDDPAANFQYFLAAYDGTKKRCSGNGETAVDAEQGSIPCTCPLLKVHEGPYEGPERPANVVCKPHGRLSVILEAAQSFGAFYTFRTTSWGSISGIAAQLDLLLQQFGFLAGLPLKLVLYPVTDQYEEKGETKKSLSYKVALVLRGSYDTARQLASSAYERREQLALPSPAQATIHQEQLLADEETAVAAAEISQEFHPESTVTENEWIDAEIEEDDPELLAKEELIRVTLRAADMEEIKINEFIAKYSDDLDAGVTFLEEKMPRRVAQARLDIREAEEFEAARQAQELAAAEADNPDPENQEGAAELVVEGVVETDPKGPKPRESKPTLEKREGDLF